MKFEGGTKLGLNDKCIYLSTQPALPAHPALPPRVAESKDPRNPVPNFLKIETVITLPRVSVNRFFLYIEPK